MSFWYALFSLLLLVVLRDLRNFLNWVLSLIIFILNRKEFSILDDPNDPKTVKYNRINNLTGSFSGSFGSFGGCFFWCLYDEAFVSRLQPTRSLLLFLDCQSHTSWLYSSQSPADLPILPASCRVRIGSLVIHFQSYIWSIFFSFCLYSIFKVLPIVTTPLSMKNSVGSKFAPLKITFWWGVYPGFLSITLVFYWF